MVGIALCGLAGTALAWFRAWPTTP